MGNPNQNIISALIRTLNEDKNVNVRLAALYNSRQVFHQPVCKGFTGEFNGKTNRTYHADSFDKHIDRKKKPAIVPIHEILTDKSMLRL